MDNSEKQKLFHISQEIPERIIPLIPAYDLDNNLHFWVLHDGKILDFNKGMRLTEGEYFAKKQISDEDLNLSFINFLYQKISNAQVFPLYISIRNDILNLASSLSKLELFFNVRKNLDISRFIVTEIEYIFYVCRSMYDLMNKIIKILWNDIRKLNKIENSRELKSLFSDLALKGDYVRDTQELIDTYKIPVFLAQFYNSEAEFFLKLRRFRIEIDHYGKSIDIIFTEPNIGVLRDFKFFEDFSVWNPQTFIRNIAPIKPILGFVIKRTLESFNTFSNKIMDEISFPPDVAPGYKVFLRGKYIKNLKSLDSMMKENIWYNDSSPYFANLY